MGLAVVGVGAARRLRGKTVARALLRPFDDGRGGRAYDPIVSFTDGSALRFVVQETEGGEYGVQLVYMPAAR